MKKYFIHYVFAFIILLAPNMAFSQWQLQTTLDGAPTAQRIEALDENIVWVCTGTGYAYRTKDGGQNWYQSTLVTSDEIIFVIDAIDSMTAFVCGGNLFSNFGNSKIYRTTDGGQNWEVVYTAAGAATFWNMIHFFDDQNGIAMSDPADFGEPYVIVKTNDGGTTWTPTSNPPAYNPGEFGVINAFQFYDEMNGWFGTSGSHVFRTTDGGETWIGYGPGNTDGTIWSVNFVSPTTGVRACDSPPYLTRTTDGGQTWTEVENLPVSDIARMQAGIAALTAEHNQIWIYGEATSESTPFIVTSTDGGQSWQQQTLPPLSGESIASLTAAVFGESVRVWAATIDRSTYTSGVQILTYTGVLGTVSDVEERPITGIIDFRLEQNYPNPFNPSTVIRYDLPKSVHVKLFIYDILGRRVRTLVDAAKPAGSHNTTWDGRNDDGAQVSNGMYVYRIEAGTFKRTRKLTLIR